MTATNSGASKKDKVQLASERVAALLSTAVGWSQEQLGSADVRKSVLLAGTGVAVVAATAGVLFWKDVRKHKSSRKPLGMKSASVGKVAKSERMSALDKVKDPLKRRLSYAKKDIQIPEAVDFVVIGSGIGGLTTAAALSRCGYTVLIVEAHDTLGGCCQTISDEYNWELGIHYIMDGARFVRPLSVLGSSELPAVEWESIGTFEDDFAYELAVYGCGDRRVEFVTRKGKRWEDLKARFTDPKDHAAIDALQAYGKDAICTLALSALARYLPYSVASVLFRLGKWKWPHVWNRDTNSVIQKLLGHNPLLALHVLGSFASETSTLFAAFSGVLHLLGVGAYFPKGGPNSVVRSLIASVDECGGNSLAAAPVSEILLAENGSRIRGVSLKCRSGELVEVSCQRGVVSAAGFNNTFRFLLPLSKVATACKQVPRRWLQTVQRIVESPRTAHSAQHFHVLLGFDKSTAELRLPQYNSYFALYEEKHAWDYDSLVADFEKDPLNAALYCFVGFPSAKNSMYAETHPNKATATVITEISFDYLSKWKDTRDADYEAIEAAIRDRLLELVFGQWPQLRECVAKVKVISPLSVRHYLKSPVGESYGLNPSCERYYDSDMAKTLSPAQPVAGLWLAGQDTWHVGFGGAFDSGVLCAQSVLGYETLSCLAAGRELIGDLRKMDHLE